MFLCTGCAFCGVCHTEQTAREVQLLQGGLSDGSVNSPVSCSPKFLFSVKVNLVQLCFLNHLISTLRPTPRWEAIASAGKAPGPESRVLACCVSCLCNLLKDSLLVGLAESFLCAEGLWPSCS